MSTTTIRAVTLLSVLTVVLMLPLTAYAQRGRGQGRGTEAQAPKPTGELVRVKAGHANVQTGPMSDNEVLVLAPKERSCQCSRAVENGFNGSVRGAQEDRDGHALVQQREQRLGSRFDD
jgi:hypothetical protein